MELAENVVVANKFRLVRELGRGGMGSVWLAQHQELDIPCAVKFIEGEAVNSAEMRDRFTREAKAAAQLRSPHVVQILDQGVWDNTPYIAMELLDGEDLGKRLKREGRLRPAQIVAILSQVGRALGKAHAVGIIHRDLKPDNVYLVRDDDRELVKILDFGIAKMNSHILGNSSNTRTGALMGTPYYMSPEQAQGTKAVDARSDVWAVGVIAFECLTGKKPFDSEALGDLLLRICAHPIPPILEAAPDLPPQAEQWWAKASARDPAQRFQTTKELVEGLAVALGTSTGGDVAAFGGENRFSTSGSPLSSTAGGMGSAGGRTVSPLVTTGDVPKKRSPALAIGAALGAVVVLGGIVSAIVFRGRGSDAPPAPAAEVTAAQPPPAPPPSSAEPPPAVAPAEPPPAVAAASASAPPVVAPPVHLVPGKLLPKTDKPPAKKVKDETGF